MKKLKQMESTEVLTVQDRREFLSPLPIPKLRVKYKVTKRQ